MNAEMEKPTHESTKTYEKLKRISKRTPTITPTTIKTNKLISKINEDIANHKRTQSTINKHPAEDNHHKS